MKSIKNLPKFNSNQISPSTILPSIENQTYTKTKRQKIQTPCAFHPSQLITNFCKNINCLLPLCPKCVKIHMQQHAQLKTLGKFQTIQDCFDEAHQSILNVFAQAAKLQKTSLQIQETFNKTKEQTLRQFQKYKRLAFQHLQNSFKNYQQTLKIQIAQQNRSFTQNLIQYHNLMSSMMENCRNGTKKFTNKTTLMQGLIGFYSKGQINQNLKKCQLKLNNLKSKKIEIMINQPELFNIDKIIQKYISFGQSNKLLNKIALQQKSRIAKDILTDQYLYQHQYQHPYSFYNQYQYYHPQISSYRNNMSSMNKQSLFENQSPNSKNNNYNNLYLNQGQNLHEVPFLHTDFIKMNTLLDNFSLQRFRNTRVNLQKIKRNNQQYQNNNM